MRSDRDKAEIRHEDLDIWILEHWPAAGDSPLAESGALLVRGVAQPALLWVVPALLSESISSERQSWLLGQVEALLRHLEIRKKGALKNWHGDFPAELHAGVLLVIAQQLARLSNHLTDVRYLNTALKILDWTKNSKDSRVAWKQSLYRHAYFECEETISRWDKKL